MEVLHHVAQDHSQNIIANIFVKEKEKQVQENEVDDTEFEDNFDKSTKFRCFKCQDIVSLKNKFNDEDHMCKLCTMTAAYGDGLVQPGDCIEPVL